MTEKVWLVIDEYDYDHDAKIFRSLESAVQHCKDVIQDHWSNNEDDYSKFMDQVESMGSEGGGFVNYASDCYINLEETEILP